ncbi:glycosyltransferase family 4 protein [Aquipuribacter nitratireducens]|uniref:D-inositol 3-phosphate glycosyltransferase n=1 Tax=Aquipuribacter nitratireducens TaxID=650104 RepID=A0ABW0GL58_9MICO
MLFVTRKFPPQTGGMETLAKDTFDALLAGGSRVTLLRNVRSDWHSWWWLPLTLWRMHQVLRRSGAERPDVVLLGDALMNAVGTWLLRLHRMPHATMVMGLDVTFDSSVYRKIVVRHLRAAPLIIAISDATARAVRAAGVEDEHLRVLRLSVVPPDDMAPREVARAELRRRFDVPDDTVVLVTVGRLVRRKGVAWFAAQVLPAVTRPTPDRQDGLRLVHLVAGAGPAEDRIRRVARSKGLEGTVRLLGRVDDPTRELLLRGADLFVQPNIHVYGDMEGFGLVNVEAAVRDLPVLAADIDGIPDAVVDGETGWLVTSQDAPRWRRRLREVLADPDALATQGRRFGATARDLYSADRFAATLHDLLEGVARGDVTARELHEERNLNRS